MYNERELNLTNKDGSFLVCATYMHGRSMYMSKRGQHEYSIYMRFITSLHVGTFRFPRQGPHQSCTFYWYSNITQYHAGGGCPIYSNSLACGTSIRGHARLSSITLTQRE